ncbi:iron hydrogenase [Clostridiaceae bacterium OM02-2AC]|nr:iron hydrogenase [Clostridiaceae bacterium OM02-2AC]
MSKHLSMDVRVPIEEGNPAIRRIESLCIKCGQCRDVCQKQISVGHHYDLLKTGDTAICIHCGQCANVCPTGAITEIQDWMQVQSVIQDSGKTVIAITSPSVRVSLGEEFGMQPGSYVEEQMVGSLRALGFDYVFDTTFAADLTIMEEASELIERIQTKQPLPQFTSCCPAWVKFAETYYPELLPNLSTSKSPISMFAPTIKTWFAEKEGLDADDIYVVAITPCTAKKFEIMREELSDAANYLDRKPAQDCDRVVTTRELAHWMRARNLDLESVEESDYDSLMPRGSGAGIIFGNTGGVMEAAIRSAYYFLTKEQPQKNLLQLEAVRGMEGVRKAELTIQELPLKVAVVHGTDNARKFLHHLKESKEHFDFVEVMTCPGGCISGGGQTKHIGEDMDTVRRARIQSLYDKDSSITLRNSHDNPHIQKVYAEFYGKPLSDLAEALLHTNYEARNDLQENPSRYEAMYQADTPAQEPVKEQTMDVRYRCTICGYIYEGDITKESDDYKCPICTVPKDMFVKVEDAPVQEPVKEQPMDVRYRCTICGYIYEGDITKEPDDYKCPICTVPKDMFVKVEDAPVQEPVKEQPMDVRYRCTICGYIYEGDITKEPDDYKCPICTVPKDMFEKI